MRALLATLALPARMLETQHGHLFPWVPVCLGIGIGLYFGLPSEPTPAVWSLIAAIWGLGVLLVWAGPGRRPLVLALLLILSGVGLCGIRIEVVEQPTLAWRYYGAVEGRVVGIDRSGSDKMRLTLDRVVLDDVAPEKTPGRIRLSLHGEQRWLTPEPGQVIAVTAHLGPPEGPVEPGGFDFQRMAWFQGLGAVGYARSPAVLLQEARSLALPVARARGAISAYVQDALPGEVGAFAAAITTGDRSGIGAETVADLRASNLAHLLAISGLHMGLLTAVVFGALRLGLSLVPALALAHPVKKWAALGALIAGAAYLALSGGNVATQRAYIMVGVMFGAVILDKRALTLRAVALAAVIVLVIRPEALVEPGFQMSFAATTALVSFFAATRHAMPHALPSWLRPLMGVVLSSAVAGAATAPIGAAHFNQIAQYGLIANLVSVPLMGVVVMPAAVLAACLAPLGLAWLGLSIMAPAIAWILFVANAVASLDGALWRVASPGGGVMPLIVLGALWVIIWRGPARLAGCLPVVAGFLVWAMQERPQVLISPGGGLIGVMTEEGRVLNKARGDGFAASSWLENDGDWPDQESASRRAGLDMGRGEARFSMGPYELVHLSGRGASERAKEACDTHDVVILAADVDGDTEPCLMVDEGLLRRTGALSLDLVDGALIVRSAAASAGERPWNGNEGTGVVPGPARRGEARLSAAASIPAADESSLR